MPTDKFVLILVIVIAAAGATVWIGTLVAASVEMPLGWFGLVPVALVVAILWRIIAERLGNRDDDNYDRIEK
ncbi:hypothetical protein [Maritimibacter sp. DP1N21-5]|uniref:hypothetical protein n=1 Tax=Maritimibacter sp. DP1N21-5 TaxID=2836867 RepID=UPI001C43D1F7|nr:hypothetical protein [Maritimibacter sp. DP1N21-5]MBV7409649.1 hypothetical protein [Maritimibacter sp. DP1N21-5]